MPKSTVTANSHQRKTGNIRPDDASVDSADTPSDKGWNGLSFLAGATVNGGSNDMGCENNDPFGASMSFNEGSWREDWRKKDNLRRHTVEQGCSTFSFPKKP